MARKYTVREFIGVMDIMACEHYESDIEKDIAIMSFLSGKPEDEFESLTLAELRREREAIEVPDLKDAPKPKQYIKAGGKTYAPVFLFKEMTGEQLIDALHFMKDKDRIIEQLPEILASICVPTKRTLWGRKRLPYNSANHRDIAADMESADIMEAYSIAVFFSEVLTAFLRDIGDYLVSEMTAKAIRTGKNLTKAETGALLNIIEILSDGMIPPEGSQNSKG